MFKSFNSVPVRVGLAVGIFLVSLALCLLLRTFIAPNFVAVFLVAVVASTSAGGLISGFVTGTLSVFAIAYFFTEPLHIFVLNSAAVTRILLFIAAATIVGLVNARERRTRRMLRQQREEVAVTLSSIGDGVIVTDADGLVTFVNPVTETLTGWRNEEIRGRPIGELFKIINEYTRQPAENPVKRVLAEGVVLGLANHTLLIAKDGTERPIDDSGAPIYDQNGNIHGAVLVFRDVTERKEAERQLEDSEARLRAVLENMPVMLLANDATPAPLVWNKECERVTGYSADEMLGNPNAVALVYRNQDLQEVLRVGRERRGDYRNWEVTLTRKDGQRRIISWNSIAKQFPISGWASWSVGIDVTERSQAERRLRLLQDVTASLLQGLTLQQTARVIVSKVLESLQSNTGAVYLLNQAGDMLEMVGYEGIAESIVDSYRHIPLSADVPLAEVIRTRQAIWIENQQEYLARYPGLEDAIRGTDTFGSATLPLLVDERLIGSVSFSIHEARLFSNEDKALLETIAQQCAQALERARLYTAEQESKAALQASERRQRFLAEASSLLAASLDYETTLDTVTQLLVPHISDWCAIDLLDDSGNVRLMSVAHVDPAKVAWGYELRRANPVDLDAPGGLAVVLRTGQTELYPVITEDMLRAAAQTPEQLEVVLQIGYSSVLIVPLIARERILGALTLVATTESNRHFDENDVKFAQELARRAAIAIDNARLFAAAQAELRQRQLAEVALRASENQMRLITDNLPVLISYVDAEFRYRFNNQSYEDWFGIQRETIAGRLMWEVVGERAFEVLRPYAERALAGEAVHYETLVPYHTAGLRHISARYIPDFDDQQQVRGFFVLVIDVTTRKQAEMRVQLLLDLTTAFSNALTPEEVGDIIVHQGVERLSANIASVALLTKERDALEMLTRGTLSQEAFQHYRRTPLSLSAPISDVVRSNEILWISTQGDYIQRYPELEQTIRENGSRTIVVLPLRNNHEVIGAMTLSFREEKQQTEVETNFFAALAQQCAQAIVRAQLYAGEKAAREAAEEANRLKVRFLGMISHELRTPLASIKGFSSSLLADDVVWDSDTQHSFIAVIDDEADKLTGLVDHLLDLSRSQAGTLRINPVPETLEHLLEIASAQLQTLAADHQLLINFPPDLPPVLIDLQRIAQVLSNLVNNAAKYAPTHTTIAVTAELLESTIKISVRDEGPGIPEEAQQYVFEAFRQVESNPHRSSGAGLGLAICKVLVEGHGGRIWIEQHEGVGSIISFTLPVTSKPVKIE
ncbi:MAG: PAS domain S-box protein [bacterium]|nr:PAS domain S-box protein [bacterium]